MRRLILFLIASMMAASATTLSSQPSAGTVLIYSGTTGYRHDSIPAGIKAVSTMATRRGLTVVTSEDPAVFSPVSLKRFKAIVLLSCTADPKNPASEWLVGNRRDALQQFVRGGGGIVGGGVGGGGFPLGNRCVRSPGNEGESAPMPGPERPLRNEPSCDGRLAICC